MAPWRHELRIGDPRRGFTGSSLSFIIQPRSTFRTIARRRCLAVALQRQFSPFHICYLLTSHFICARCVGQPSDVNRYYDMRNDNRFFHTSFAESPIQIRCVSDCTSYNSQVAISSAIRRALLGDTVLSLGEYITNTGLVIVARLSTLCSMSFINPVPDREVSIMCLMKARSSWLRRLT